MCSKLLTYHKQSNLIRIKILLWVQITNKLIVILSITLNHRKIHLINYQKNKIETKIKKKKIVEDSRTIFVFLPKWLQQVRL